ncbi:hypothetical protein HDE_10122 [Halotydeus destructor]|nr:hypothetical protein HDE_10122 [Halotydeus destructor]
MTQGDHIRLTKSMTSINLKDQDDSLISSKVPKLANACHVHFDSTHMSDKLPDACAHCKEKDGHGQKARVFKVDRKGNLTKPKLEKLNTLPRSARLASSSSLFSKVQKFISQIF